MNTSCAKVWWVWTTDRRARDFIEPRTQWASSTRPTKSYNWKVQTAGHFLALQAESLTTKTCLFLTLIDVYKPVHQGQFRQPYSIGLDNNIFQIIEFLFVPFQTIVLPVLFQHRSQKHAFDVEQLLATSENVTVWKQRFIGEAVYKQIYRNYCRPLLSTTPHLLRRTYKADVSCTWLINTVIELFVLWRVRLVPVTANWAAKLYSSSAENQLIADAGQKQHGRMLRSR